MDTWELMLLIRIALHQEQAWAIQAQRLASFQRFTHIHSYTQGDTLSLTSTLTQTLSCIHTSIHLTKPVCHCRQLRHSYSYRFSVVMILKNEIEFGVGVPFMFAAHASLGRQSVIIGMIIWISPALLAQSDIELWFGEDAISSSAGSTGVCQNSSKWMLLYQSLSFTMPHCFKKYFH